MGPCANAHPESSPEQEGRTQTGRATFPTYPEGASQGAAQPEALWAAMPVCPHSLWLFLLPAPELGLGQEVKLGMGEAGGTDGPNKHTSCVMMLQVSTAATMEGDDLAFTPGDMSCSGCNDPQWK